MSKLSRFRQSGRAFLFSVSVLCVVTIAFLALEIVRDLRLLDSATSDNVQWTLSQSEVEFLELRFAVDRAQHVDNPDLEKVIEEFDIFYSRVSTLETGAVYAELRDVPGFVTPLSNIRELLDNLVPVIDGPRDELINNLGAIDAELEDGHRHLRAMSTAGLIHFAEVSDQQRRSLTVTLLRLATFAAVLVFALVMLLRHASRVTRQTEQRGRELSAAYARQNAILETSLDAVIVADMGGRIRQFNPAAERIFKADSLEVVGRTIGEVIVPEHLLKQHDAAMIAMHETGRRKVVGQGRVRLDGKRSDGEVFPVELALEAAMVGNEEILIGFLRDISHRVSSENELVEARDKALAGEKAKAEFLAMMTHEIRTPLNGVLGNLSLLEETRLTPAQHRYVHNMNISGKLLMSHVDAVLDIARFESHATTAEATLVHLGHIVQDVIDSQTIAAEGNGNTLGWEWVGTPVNWAMVDSSRLQQVLLNLIGNAIKFTQNGSVAMEVERAEPTDVDPDADNNAISVEFRVIDTGAGIAEAELERVFDDFQTTASATEQSVSGTGLGLGIARRFVQAMGGEIGAESTLGEGSVFWVRLPITIAEAPTAEEHAPEPDPVEVLVDRKILLVEDNEINLYLARDMLKKMGHHVTVARDGREGVTAAEAEPFDLVLMDIRMPVMDGLAATKAIREGQGPNQDAPIVALSANVLPESKEKFISSGMSGFLGKPLDKLELEQVIAQFCAVPVVPATPEPTPAADLDPIAALKARYVAETNDLFDWLDGHPETWDEIANRAHQVAGSAAAFGHADLRMALLHVETAAEAEDAKTLISAIETARRAWETAPEPDVG